MPRASSRPVVPSRVTAVDRCAASLRDRILGGELRPGSRLPPERDLSRSLGVTRVTLRSALSRVSTERLVTVRHGSGYEVRDWRLEAGLDRLLDLARLRHGRELAVFIEDVLELRRAVVRGVLVHLSTGVAPEATRAIDQAIDALADLVAAGAAPRRLVDADLAVLRTIVTATGSAVYSLCLNSIALLLSELPRVRRAFYQEAVEVVLGWRLFRAWLDAPEPEGIDTFVSLLAALDARAVARLARRAH